MWDRVEPLMPTDPVCDRRWADHRRTLEAIAWRYRTCSPRRDLPDELGLFQTAHKRLIRQDVDGTWERILAAVLAGVRVLTASAGPCRRTSRSARWPISTSPEPGKGAPDRPKPTTKHSDALEAA